MRDLLIDSIVLITNYVKKLMARYFSRSQKLLILRKSNYKCVICGSELNIDNFVADHIIPYSKGGPTQNWNGQALCSLCNIKKSDSMPDT